MTYARETRVPVDATAAEIQRLVGRYGARKFAHMTDEDEHRAVIMFSLNDRSFRFVLPLPTITDEAIRLTPETKKLRSLQVMRAAYEQAVKQRWRALLLVIRAKFEAIEAGITTVEEEFLAQTMTAEGSTVWEQLGPQLAAGVQSVQLQITAGGREQ